MAVNPMNLTQLVPPTTVKSETASADALIPYTTRFSYAASDMAGQLVFCVISFYILKFYTDVAGLSASVAGTILLVARMVDAVDTPVWGIVFDKTHSRLGKSRPWFLWLCLPFAVFGMLTFLIPNLSSTARAIYAGGTYMICSVIFTGINTPITSILSALTQDPKKRVMLTCYRMFGSKAGVLLVNATAWPLVAWLGQGNDKKGFMLTMPIFAFGSVVLFLLAFYNLKETIPEERKPVRIKESFGAVKGNWPWIIIFCASLSFWVAFIVRISVVPYFFEYSWHRKDLVPVANSLDVVSLASIFLLPWFCKWTSKRNVWACGLFGSIIAQFIILAGVRTHSLTLVFTGWVMGILTSGVAMALPFSLLSDSVDFGEWKSGIRAGGFLTAIGAAFCLKAGSGIGGALPAWILSAYGYVPNVAQSAGALKGIEIDFIWMPVVFYAFALIPVLFYRKYEEMEPRIQRELKQRREAAALIGADASV
jgi:sugar (glycoside-pentoside-hexuronide) transporter